MAVLNESAIRTRARRRASARGESVEDELRRVAGLRSSRYDIFLSQTIRDAEIVLGVYDLLTTLGYAVFCDWIITPHLERSQVTPANAEFIRSQMRISDTLLFVDSENADQSLWMCWEIGWFDGAKGHVAVLPVLPDDGNYYNGREFLGLYPYARLGKDGQLEIVRPPATNRRGVTLFEAPNSRSFDQWRNGDCGFMRPKLIEHW